MDPCFTRFDAKFSCDTFGEAGKEWLTRTHQEGPIYYRSDRIYNRQSLELVTQTDKHGIKLKLLTEANVQSVEIRDQIEGFIVELLQIGRRSDGTYASGYDLAETEIFLKQQEGRVGWSYYIVDHQCRSIFWLHSYRQIQLTTALGGVDSDKEPSTAKIHLRMCDYNCTLTWLLIGSLFAFSGRTFEVEYWHHVDYFPHHYRIPSKVVKELCAILNYNTIGWWCMSNSTMLDTEYQIHSCVDI